MIISHRHRFVFVKTVKTAGTSIEIMLSQFCGPSDVITAISPEDEAIRRQLGFPGAQNYSIPFRGFGLRDWGRLLLRGRQPTPLANHAAATRIRGCLGGRRWRTYLTFCVERNPWDKVLSLWHFAGRPGTLHDFIMSPRLTRLSSWRRYTDRDRVIVDRILRYENLQAELQSVIDTLGLKWDGALPRAKAGFRTDRRPYWEVLTPAEGQRIAEVFAKEIALFNYSFEPAPHVTQA